MSDATATDVAGLHIVGEVALGFRRRRARATRGRVRQHRAGRRRRRRWLIVRPDGTSRRTPARSSTGRASAPASRSRWRTNCGVPRRCVEVVLGDTALVPWDMGTFGSQSTARVGLQLRKAAATAREALLGLAADRLDCRRANSARPPDASRPGASRSQSRYAELMAGTIVEQDIDDDIALTPAGRLHGDGTHAAPRRCRCARHREPLSTRRTSSRRHAVRRRCCAGPRAAQSSVGRHRDRRAHAGRPGRSSGRRSGRGARRQRRTR